ncbi:ferredoxin [Nanoarchaeota archaeon]
MKVKVEVDKETCIGCGTCIAIAPEIFDFDSDGKSKPKIDIIDDPKMIEKVKDSEAACPTHSIKVTEIRD